MTPAMPAPWFQLSPIGAVKAHQDHAAIPQGHEQRRRALANSIAHDESSDIRPFDVISVTLGGHRVC
jgi:hypothetical protein